MSGYEELLTVTNGYKSQVANCGFRIKRYLAMVKVRLLVWLLKYYDFTLTELLNSLPYPNPTTIYHNDKLLVTRT